MIEFDSHDVAHSPAPTLEEIADRAEAIRVAWSEGVRRRRRVGRKQTEWQPPCAADPELSRERRRA